MGLLGQADTRTPRRPGWVQTWLPKRQTQSPPPAPAANVPAPPQTSDPKAESCVLGPAQRVLGNQARPVVSTFTVSGGFQRTGREDFPTCFGTKALSSIDQHPLVQTSRASWPDVPKFSAAFCLQSHPSPSDVPQPRDCPAASGPCSSLSSHSHWRHQPVCLLNISSPRPPFHVHS